MKETGYSDGEKWWEQLHRPGLFEKVVMFKLGLEGWEGAHEKSGLKSIAGKGNGDGTFFL